LYKEFKRLNDSITDVQRTTQISEIHAKYQTMEKIQENELLTKDNQIIQDQLKRRGYYIFGVVALVIMLIVFTLFLYRSYTNKLKLNELLTIQKQETENRAEELIIMNEKLKELDDFKLGMMSMIVHDLKNPLNSILMLSEQINSEKYGKLIRNSSMLMKNLIMNIIDVQRLENAHLPFDLTTCSFLKLVNIALDEVDFLIKQKSLEIENNIHQNPSVKCDNELIKRVLVNLLTNAIKFTPANGKIILNVEKNVEGFIKIMISDTGEGIPQEKINEVFDKFVQIKDRKSGSLRASGLGLAFCKLVIEQSGGKIGVISTNKSELTDNSDITTTFWFTLPSVMDSSDNFQVDTFDLNQAKYIAFTQKEKKRLNTVIPQISPLKVYQTSEILTLLSQINDESESIKKWKAEVEYAVFSGNEKKFNELISL
jgi:signal transduction histidine kinase